MDHPPRSPAADPASTRRAWRSLRALGVALVAAALLAMALAAALGTERGGAWLLNRLPGLSVSGVSGSLFHGPLKVERVSYAAGAQSIVIDALTWRDLRWQWRPHRGAWLGLSLRDAHARRVTVSGAASDAPASVPNDLLLPFALQVKDLQIATLQIDGAAPIVGLHSSFELGANGGTTHRLHDLTFAWDRLRGQWQGELAAQAPLTLRLRGRLSARDASTPPWQADVDVAGPLPRLALQARLNAQSAAFSADLSATLTPFERWPLAALQARLQDLDLSALHSAAPSTRLSGQARMLSSGLDQPFEVEASLDNSQPGRWDAGRLPLRQLRFALGVSPRQPDALEIRQFFVQLGTPEQDGGRIEGQGQWLARKLTVQARLDGLRPAQIDNRLAAMRLSGPLTLALEGLSAAASAPGADTPGAAEPPPVALSLQATLDGRLDKPGAASARLALDLGGTRQRDGQLQLDLRRFEARAGAGSASLSGTLARDAGATWRLRGDGRVTNFDPRLWWPGRPAAGPREPAHRLNGQWQATLTATTPGARHAPWSTWLQGVRGATSLQWQDSLLAGIASRGRLALRADPGPASVLQMQAEMQLADNRLSLSARHALGSGSGTGTGTGTADQGQLDVSAPNLAALAPLARLDPRLAAWAPRAGSLSGQVTGTGRWPQIASRGQLQGSGLQLGEWQAARVQADWQAGGHVASPLALKLDAESVRRGTVQLDRLQAQLQGTLQAHQLSVQASSPGRPPAWVVSAADAVSGSQLQLNLNGSWQPAPRKAGPGAGFAGGLWRGEVQELSARPRKAAADGVGIAPWLQARALVVAVGLDGAGALRSARAEPGRIELAGGALRWTQASWDAATPAGNSARLALDAELEPTRVAPWLARLQPGAGWSGDLTLGARLQLRQAGAVEADLLLDRRAGDLLVGANGQAQPLGLSELRLTAKARAGVWQFGQSLVAANVGVLSGAQTLRTAPDARWPAPDSALQGTLDLRVDRLDVWAPWVPPGWRLGGRLQGQVALSGRYGAPEYRGELHGSDLAMRNLLQGVDWRQGELAIALRGSEATIERLSFKGGDGELRLAGNASFGAEPRAQLRLQTHRFRLLSRFDRRLVTSGKAELDLHGDSLKVDGLFSIDEGLIDFTRADAPALDSDVSVLRRAQGADPAPAQTEAEAPRRLPAALRRAKLDLQVDLGQRLVLRGRGLDTRLGGRLALSAPGGRLAVHGAVRAESGTYAAYGQKLAIEQGQIIFGGALENPRLDVVAVRPNLDLRVGVAVSGTALTPRVRLFSEPEMSDMDKLSWLLLGRAPEGLDRADTALLQRAALALLAGDSGRAANPLLGGLGLDDLSLRQTDEEGKLRETVVTVGKQLSRRWYVGYERSVQATTGTWQLIYRTARRFTLRAQTGLEDSLDVIWTWRWN